MLTRKDNCIEDADIGRIIARIVKQTQWHHSAERYHSEATSGDSRTISLHKHAHTHRYTGRILDELLHRYTGRILDEACMQKLKKWINHAQCHSRMRNRQQQHCRHSSLLYLVRQWNHWCMDAWWDNRIQFIMLKIHSSNRIHRRLDVRNTWTRRRLSVRNNRCKESLDSLVFIYRYLYIYTYIYGRVSANKPQRTIVRPTTFDEHDVQTVRPTNNSETNIETNEIKWPSESRWLRTYVTEHKWT